jgi:hypothetical protein
MFFRSLLVLLAAVRVKYPGHTFCGPVSCWNKLDWVIRSLLVLLSATDYANLEVAWWIPMLYVAIPCYPWHVILTAVVNDRLNGLLAVISIYGLLQSPWKSLVIYRGGILVTAGVCLYIYLIKLGLVNLIF